MTDVDIEKENAEIAKAYKKLLKVSYQTLTTADKKLIRHAFEVVKTICQQRKSKS
jgi:GTP pyrophosphokinase